MKIYNLLLFFLILSSGLVSASPLELTFLKENYFVGEPIQGEIYLDNVISTISSGTIILQKNESIISFYPYISNLGNNYFYFYFGSTNLMESSYSLIFEDIIYSLNGSTQQNDFKFDFNLIESNSSIISFSPGLIDARVNSLFEIYLKNEGNEFIQLDLTGSADFIEISENNFQLISEESKLVTVYISELLSQNTSGMEYVFLNQGDISYSIPVWLGVEEIDLAGNDNEIIEIDEIIGELSFVVDNIDQVLENGESVIGGFVKIMNPTNTTITNISISIDDSLIGIVNLETFYFDELGSGEEGKVYLDINKENFVAGIYTGKIYLKSGDINEELSLSIEILEEFLEIEESINETEEFEIIEEEFEIIEEEKDSEERVAFKVSIWVWALLFIFGISLLLYLVYKKKKKKTNFPFSGN